jgi:hypothetical protein
MPEHDNKAYYFGLSFGLNFSQYRLKYTDEFAATDTFKRIQPYVAPGFGVALMGNLRLNRFVDIRTIPGLSFTSKRLQYNAPLRDSVIDRTVESIYFNLPVHLKFKSDRLKNFRFYAIAGGKFDYDLAANARSRKSDEFLKVKPLDLGYELGFGFEFYYPNFIFAPEIRISEGFVDQLFRDPNLQLTNAISALRTRTVVISIHLEG